MKRINIYKIFSKIDEIMCGFIIDANIEKFYYFLAEIGTNGSICIAIIISSLGNVLKVRQIFTIYLLTTLILDDFYFQCDHS